MSNGGITIDADGQTIVFDVIRLDPNTSAGADDIQVEPSSSISYPALSAGDVISWSGSGSFTPTDFNRITHAFDNLFESSAIGRSFANDIDGGRYVVRIFGPPGPEPEVSMSLDVDGNGTVGLLTDGLLIVRYLIGTRGSALTDGAVAGDAHEDRDSPEEIAAYLQGLVDGDVLDVDGNGTVGLLTDGLLIVRYLVGTRGPALTDGAVAGDAHADRDSPEEIAAYLDSLLPSE